MTPPTPPPRDRILSLLNGGRRLPRRDGDGEEDAGADEAGDRWIWRGLELGLGDGEVLAVQGPTGAGKSLLLRALGGLDALDEGQVRLLERPADAWEVTRYRSAVSYLHQAPALFPGGVEENLREPFDYAVHEGRAYERERALRLLRPLGRGGGFLDRRVEGLSGGERQIVALVRAMLPGPRVLLLDEPTAALDPDATATVEELVRRWLEDGGAGDAADGPGRAALWVTHDEVQARRASDRTLRLAGGRLDAT